MVDIELYRRTLLAKLQAEADALGPAKYEMYRDGIHTGHLNALDPISPHCVTTASEALEWYDIGSKYISDWAARHSHTPDGKHG